MHLTCGDCVFFNGSSVRKKDGRRFCIVAQQFVSPSCASTCRMFRYDFPEVWYCDRTQKSVTPRACLACAEKGCDKGILARKYLRLQKPFREGVQMVKRSEVKDVRAVLESAIQALNKSKLSPRYVPLPENIHDLSDKDLQSVVEQFLDAVELIPMHCEPDIPDIVVKVYNGLVTGEYVVFGDAFEILGRPVVVKEESLKFRRRVLPQQAVEECSDCEA